MDHQTPPPFTQCAKDYFERKRIHDLFQSLTIGLVYHRPTDPVEFLRRCLDRVQRNGGADRVDWQTFLPAEAPGGPARPGHVDPLPPPPSAPVSRRVQVRRRADTDRGTMDPRPTSMSLVAGGTEAKALQRGESTTSSDSADSRAFIMQSLSDGSGGRRPPDLETETAEGDGGLESDMDDGDETDYERLIDARFWDVLCGTTKDLPVMPTNTVRIFLSSTFSDFKAERNMLPQVAYPQLERFCSDLGIDFQVVDMRWGVTDEVINDHQVMPLCIAEIKMCQQLSCGPNFVVLLGDRYGWQGFPPNIPCEEFDILLQESQWQGLETHILTDWFLRDDNAVPPEYILQPIHSRLHHYHDTGEENQAKKEADRKKWDVIFAKLQQILRLAAKKARESGAFTVAQEHKYFCSVTEEEIHQGLFKSDRPGLQALCFQRSLLGIHDSLSDNYVTKFIDLTESREIDAMALSLRKDLIEKRVPEQLPHCNIKKYDVVWKGIPLEQSSHDDHDAYLKRFCNDFVSETKSLICQNRPCSKDSDGPNEAVGLYYETLHHARFSKIKCEVFLGRSEEVRRVRDYLTTGVGAPHHPLIVHGESGMGKTALMAYVANGIHQWISPKSVVMRFLGTSPHSSAIADTLLSIIHQLSLVFKIKRPDESTLTMFGDIRRRFRWFLEKISSKTVPAAPVVLLVDSADQLSRMHGAHRMVWVPKVLPPNVYMVVSMLTDDERSCLANTKKRLTESSCYLELQPLSEFTGDQIMDSHLVRCKRKLTTAQHNWVINAFKNFRHPLFLKLVIDDAKRWSSYTPLPETRWPVLGRPRDAVQDAILKLFESLEVKYGAMFVSHALGYLTCGRGGLTEIEMEDLLSCDNDVLNEVYQYHDPPLEGVIRIPSLLWARLQYSLKEYLCERRVDGKVVLAWYHRQFWEAAEFRYLEPEGMRKNLHEALAEVFLQETGIRKTITLHQRKGKVIENANRNVKLQPFTVSNHRKLNAVPYHYWKAGNLPLLKQHCLLNFEWLLAKLQAFEIKMVLREYDQVQGDPDVNFFGKFLELCFDALGHDPTLLVYNVLERFKNCVSQRLWLQNIIQQAETWLDKAKIPLLVPTHPIQLRPADSPQQFSIMLGYNGILSKDEQMIVCNWSDQNSGVSKIQTLDLAGRDIVASVNIVKPTLFQILPDNHHFVFIEEKHVNIVEMDSGDMIRKFPFHEKDYEQETVRCMAISDSGKYIAFGVRFGKPRNTTLSKSWRKESNIFLVDLEKDVVICSTVFKNKKHVDWVSFVLDDSLLVATSRDQIFVYDAQDLTTKAKFPQHEDLIGNTLKRYPSKNMIVGVGSSKTAAKLILFDYKEMEVRCSENVHIDGDQKSVVPFAVHADDNLSAVLIGSYGQTTAEPLSSICKWGPSEGKSDAQVKIKLQPRGFKAPVSLSSSPDWRYALIGWQCGRITIVDLETQTELRDTQAHGHAINFMEILSDGRTLLTMSQDHSLKGWDLPLLLNHAKNDDKHEESQPSEDFLDDTNQCLDAAVGQEFIVTGPPNNITGPRFWSYANGTLITELSEPLQDLYSKSIAEKGFLFTTRTHANVTLLPNDILVYERKKRNEMILMVTQGYGTETKLVAHELLAQMFFRLFVPQEMPSGSDMKNVWYMYAVHDGVLVTYDMTIRKIQTVTIPAITGDIPDITSNGGKRKLLYYHIAVTQDLRYFVIFNPGRTDSKFMDVIQLKKGRFKKRFQLSRFVSWQCLSDGVYFYCKNKGADPLCLSAQKCIEAMEAQKADFHYRCLLYTGSFLSADQSIGFSFDNKKNVINIWQVYPLLKLHTLQGHLHEVTSGDISPDNRFFVSGSYDNTVRVWSVLTGTQLCMFHVYRAVDDVKFSPNMSHVFVQCYSQPQRKRGVVLELKNLEK